MGQPLHDKSPAFCLVIFGSENSFNNIDVLNRWRYVQKELNKSEITIFGFSSDADRRCLKAMRIQSGLLSSISLENKDSPYGPYFQCKYGIHSPVYIQDAVHIGTKMKTTLLKPNVVLLMERFFVSKDFIEKLIEIHLQNLIVTVTKDKHLLCNSDLDNADKMNFRAIDKISSNEVIKLLHGIPESDATIQYLQITRNIIDAFLNKSSSIADRIYKIWYSTFFLRIWRSWLTCKN
ncbi:hypothetical protein RN001_004298 [Aquatica leii]|uniref:Uncharacterized protein n=1 Tax=Aquatica leii TaxID=1421715 RepID=A0AAN7SI00_9COLE|nr:hypothetical protein RN001_004298 [Aquatica leii]